MTLSGFNSETEVLARYTLGVWCVTAFQSRKATAVAPSRVVALTYVLLLLLCLNGPLPAQLRVQPVGELPADVSLRLMLRKLNAVGTFMETTAHPDDEDNALLAMMSHGAGLRSVLVSATRGDGGQNEIGPEIFQALGVLRTEELLAVHRFDGAEQYFTRAIDFGYSFSLDESIQKWGHEEIVGDFVRHIRATRPDVIAGFICGGDGGGQHHQASTRLTAEAFRAAADASRYPEQIREGLRPWQAKRLFCLQGFSFQGQPAALTSRDLLRVAGVRIRPAPRPHVQRAWPRSAQHAQVSGNVAAVAPAGAVTGTDVPIDGDRRWRARRRAGAHVRRDRHDADRAWRLRRPVAPVRADRVPPGHRRGRHGRGHGGGGERACRRRAAARRRSCRPSRSPREAAHARAERDGAVRNRVPAGAGKSSSSRPRSC